MHQTIGDCYVCVTGVPTFRKDHALAMARFARDCVTAFHPLTRALEAELGPSTVDLAVRIGIHSGPLTAGVVRGQRARFQLFGHTVHVASRIESLGKPNRIHLTGETAEQLIQAGKSHWVVKREDPVYADGKGKLQTYWLQAWTAGSAGSSTTPASELMLQEEKVEQNVSKSETDPKQEQDFRSNNTQADRLVKWNVDILKRFLKQVIACRKESKVQQDSLAALESQALREKSDSILDNAKDFILIPAQQPSNHTDITSIELDEKVESQLLSYVRAVSAMYRDNPFHNFEHASHVTISLVKLLSRVVPPMDTKDSGHPAFGLATDPLAQFAMVLSALLHSTDHPGVPNIVIVSEGSWMAQVYKNRSVLQQNAFSLGWSLLMEDGFTNLRHAIYTVPDEFRRFQQWMIHSTLATDTEDEQLCTLRIERWTRAFPEAPDHLDPKSAFAARCRKATAIVELLLQAAHMAHMMQHWQLYGKWNERLFDEHCRAYQNGRTTLRPAESWYQSQLASFDNKVIPLSQRLAKVCLGSSDEHLNLAQRNRQEWQRKGQTLVASMVQKLSQNSHNQ